MKASNTTLIVAENNDMLLSALGFHPISDREFLDKIEPKSFEFPESQVRVLDSFAADSTAEPRP